jgi:hypothetical protein
MKEFRTELIPAVSASSINLKDRIFTIGSCFADTMGSYLIKNKLNVWNNRFGAVYNPLPIHQLILFGLQNRLPGPKSYLQNEEINLNYHFHSSYSSRNRQELQTTIESSIGIAHEFLKNTNRIVITYGTAWVYQLKDSLEVVANCHKTASTNFNKSLLTERDIVESFQHLYAVLKSVNPNCRVILTVSPVRHLKDTLELNAVSKSILRLSCHSIVNQFSDVAYFPAYEILLDDLRDYRFYGTDRLHPTAEAVEYIWEKFVYGYFDQPTQQFINDWREIIKDLEHKPFHPQSENHQKFLKSTLVKLEGLPSFVDVSDEIRNLKFKINSNQSRAYRDQ